MRELVYHEFCLAEAAGEGPDPADYLVRFPEVRQGLARLFGLHEALERDSRGPRHVAAPELPEAGDEIGPYLLLRELGRGGLGRVFLAEQGDLEDRLVVLKITARPSPEADLLARARHPHIVEVFRRGEVAGGRLHLIAMPFLGGASLAAVLAERCRTGGGRTGRGWLAALDRAAAPEFSPDVSRSANRALLARLTHAQSAAWMVARLAEALDHANRVGVTHGDLKPANILIAADGRPMLLDFNLAVDWRSADAALGGVTGGTLAYMAPERLRALADPKSAPPIRPADRHRADLYALGLVLREMITGRPPEVPVDPPVAPAIAAARLAEARERADPSCWSEAHGIPVSLRPILARLLAPDPIDRYANMGELAEDLDRWGAGSVPIHTRHADVASGLLHRMKRFRWGILVAAGALIVFAAIGLAVHSMLGARLRSQAESKLEALWNTGDPAIFRTRRFGRWDRNDISELSRRNLDHYGAMQGGWRTRDDVRALGPEDRADLEMWILEHSWRLAADWSERPDSPEDWRRALALLEQSPEWASLPAFEPLRASLRERMGLPGATHPLARPARWLSRYADGLASEGRSANDAGEAYESVLSEWPGALWPRYRAAVMALRQNRPGEAVDHLTRCLARWTRNPALWTMRGSCKIVAGDPSGGLADCDRAVELDPDYPDAYLARCVARNRLNILDGQEADATRLAQISRAGDRALSLGLNLTRSGLSGAEPPTGVTSEDANLRAMIANQLLRAGRADEALAMLDLVVAAAPDHLSARYDRACILLQQKRNEGLYECAALAAHARFDELVSSNPGAIRILHQLAYHRLRQGDPTEALSLARRGLTLALESRRPGEPEAPIVAESRFALARALV